MLRVINVVTEKILKCFVMASRRTREIVLQCNILNSSRKRTRFYSKSTRPSPDFEVQGRREVG